MNETKETLSSPTALPEVKLTDLPGLIDKNKVGDAVIVTDADCQVFVLLDNLDGQKYWQHTHGKSIEETIKFNEWFKLGQAKFKENAVTREFLEQLREVLLATSVLGNFFGWDEENVGSMVDAIIVKLAHQRYCEEKKIECTIDDLKDNEDFMPYIQMVTIYAQMFLKIVDEARASAAQAKVEVENLPKT